MVLISRFQGSLSPQSSVSSECDIWHPLINEYFDLCRTILKNYQKEREPPLDELIAFCRYLLRCGRKSSDAVRAQVILKGVNTYRELEEVIMVMSKWLSFSFLERIVERSQTHPTCLLYTSPSPRDRQKSRMPSSA